VTPRDWLPFNGGECPVEEEILLDIRFDGGDVLEKLYPWDVKWDGKNPGFGYVTGYRESEVRRKSFAA
jgi:hypothetical protein